MLEDEEILQQAKNVLNTFNLELSHSLSACSNKPQYLQLDKNGLAIVCPALPEIRKPLRVDFVHGALGRRSAQAGREMLQRAFGLHRGKRPKIMDCTGGLGRDAFLLAAAGCVVEVYEKNQVIAALLSDGLQRAAENAATGEIVQRISLHVADSLPVLQDMESRQEKIDAVYLDPMFPVSRKNALVKKEAQVLQLLAGDDDSGEQLFTLAKACARRVVVKRPAIADFLSLATPDYSLKGKAVRFDVYLQP